MLKKLSAKLFLRNKNYLGIDIGHKNIKMVEILPGNPSLISKIDFIPTPENSMDNGDILRSEVIGKAIQTMVEKNQPKSRQVVTTITGKNLIKRYIKLPKMSPQEVASTLKWEAEKYIPLSTEDELIVEHIVLGEEGEEVNVLLVAVPRRLIYQLHEVFSHTGLELMAVEIVPLSLWRSVGTNVGKGTGRIADHTDAIITLDIGGRSSNLAVFHGERLHYSRYIPLGGDNITEYIADTLGLGFDAAQVVKENDGALLSPETLNYASGGQVELDQVLRGGMVSLVNEIRRSIDYYRTQDKKHELKAIVLTGGTAKLQGITEYFQTEFDLPTTRGLQNMTLGQQENKSHHRKFTDGLDPVFAVAIGLAQRSVVE